MAKEFHKDGGTHFHAYLKCASELSVKSANFFDIPVTILRGGDHGGELTLEEEIMIHGNYKSVTKAQGGKQGWIKYISKEDKEIYMFGSISPEAILKAGKNHTQAAYEELMRNGGNLTSELLLQYPQLFPNLRKVTEACALFKRLQSTEKLEQPPPSGGWYSWQKTVLNLIGANSSPRPETSSVREITWIVDEVGNNGKTWLARYLVANHRALYITGGKEGDVAHAYNGEPVIVFDFSRAKQECVNYGSIESLKNGFVFATKYESGVKIYSPPWVIVFSNWPPEMDKFSADRWGEGPYKLSPDRQLLTSRGDPTTLSHLYAPVEFEEIEEIVNDVLETS